MSNEKIIEYRNGDNFEFKLEGRIWTMRQGQLDVDEVLYEDVDDGGSEIYEIARAYALALFISFNKPS